MNNKTKTNNNYNNNEEKKNPNDIYDILTIEEERLLQNSHHNYLY